jgi:hypothetical protein
MTIEEYLKDQLGYNVKKHPSYPRPLLFTTENNTLLKLERYNKEVLNLYKSLINNKNLPVVKIYKAGSLNLPKDISPYPSQTTFHYYEMEYLSIPTSLKSNLKKIEDLGDDLNQSTGEKIWDGVSLIGSAAEDVYVNNKSNIKKTLKYVKDTQPKTLYSLLVEIINIISILKKNNIFWWDVHYDQFGYNSEGKLVAFDIDNLK